MYVLFKRDIRPRSSFFSLSVRAMAMAAVHMEVLDDSSIFPGLLALTSKMRTC